MYPGNGHRKRESPAEESVPTAERSAELCSDERGDASTGLGGDLLALGLREDANERLGARRPDQDPARPAKIRVASFNLRRDRLRQLVRRHRDVLLDLR